MEEGIAYCDVHAWTEPTRHHIIPRSRDGGDTYLTLWEGPLQGIRKLLGMSLLRGSKSNVNKKACGYCHPYLHLLFANKLPYECVDQLVHLWGGQKRWIYIWVCRDIAREIKRFLRLSPPVRNGEVVLEELQTDRLHRTLQEEMRVREVVREFGLPYLEGELRIRKAQRELAPGSLCHVADLPKEVIRSVRRDEAKTPQELLEKLLDGRELGPYESIRTVIWKKNPTSAAS